MARMGYCGKYVLKAVTPHKAQVRSCNPIAKSPVDKLFRWCSSSCPASPQSCGFHGWVFVEKPSLRTWHLRNRVQPLYVVGTSGPRASSAMIARLLQVTAIEAGQTVGSTLVARKLLVAM
jgi:hypothetical protein